MRRHVIKHGSAHRSAVKRVNNYQTVVKSFILQLFHILPYVLMQGRPYTKFEFGFAIALKNLHACHCIY